MNNHGSGSCGVGLVCDIRGIYSRDIVRWGIEAVTNLTHRGAVGADGKTGDGAGIMVRIPEPFFLRELERLGGSLSDPDNLAVGFFFLYGADTGEIESVVRKHGLSPVVWRDVPCADGALGESACAVKPDIRQLILDTDSIEVSERESRLYLARRALEQLFGEKLYIPSMSSKTIVYKGMLIAPNLDRFYTDLSDDDFISSFCMFHQRFSTNTFPDWRLAQPLRTMAHNGEINTVWGNRNWMSILGTEVFHDTFKRSRDALVPLVSEDESDSASLDRIVELLVLSGSSPEKAVNICIPPAWEGSELPVNIKAFYEFQSLLMKPWDGPAAVTFSDGDVVGAHLDRNGLRPLRYTLTEDGILVIGSEAGMIDLGDRQVIKRCRLGPGETITVDLRAGRVRYTNEIMEGIAASSPYKEWLDASLVRINRHSPSSGSKNVDITRSQIAFGYSAEEIGAMIRDVAITGKEKIHSMGDDTPLPPLSERPQLLFRYFKQRFSQVTNPPIASIRERMVMSLKMNLGPKLNFLIETDEHARRLHLESPILGEREMQEIGRNPVLPVEKVSIVFDGSTESFESAVERVRKRVCDAVREGVGILVLSDMEMNENRYAVPSMLALSSSFVKLQREGLAHRVSFIVETGEVRDVHHIACLIGFGAGAVHPYLAFRTIGDLCERKEISIPEEEAVSNYRTALEEELLKTIARMGISTLNAYHGARLFDTCCLNEDFVREYFGDMRVVVEADGLSEVESSVKRRHAAAFGRSEPELEPGGDLKHSKGGELHAWSPHTVAAFAKFIKEPGRATYDEFAAKAREGLIYVRHLLGYKKSEGVDIGEVEKEEQILKRFVTGAMSVGSLSPEAHETIAEACNRLGIRSNSGEGGENPGRYWTVKNSAIKQIASGRFGVTPTYIASARDLEIKMAQGAKPGEGGHLPSLKVSPYIAGLRYCGPNTLLISPPPHHDIYSIEDLAQLINDLKEANPEARVCVKLVAENGVGTVAAGVAKAYADIIQISGCEGGTGAAAVSSIKNAGNYWETGLYETQRTLMENDLRGRIRLRVDGGLRTGRDVVIAALLGAEEFGFGTAAMIAAGCVMARKCHLNTCPTGIATQDERLRGKYKGRVEAVMAYFRFVAGEVREILAAMGCRSFDEIVGRPDLLVRLPVDGPPGAVRVKADRLFEPYPVNKPRTCSIRRNDNPAPSLNAEILKDVLPFIEKGEKVEREYAIRNVNRSVPLRLNYYIARQYRDDGLPPDTIMLTFRGTAGQSFGAFNHKGLSLTLIGEANDYVGKGMYGGRIAIRPIDPATSQNQVILGNTVLYGATGGEFFAAGRAGERFGVRNSGAITVVEGTGHHLAEYMTGGVIVVLGPTGYNVGAGMTGGIVFILDGREIVETKLNNSYVTAQSPGSDELGYVRDLIERHYRFTGSLSAGEILENFGEAARYFLKITPRL